MRMDLHRSVWRVPRGATWWYISDLQPLFEQWGTSGHERAAEFMHDLLGWMQIRVLSHSWERRFSTLQGLHISNSGGTHVSLAFAWTADLDEKVLSLQEIVGSWTYSLGMRSGLVGETSLPLLVGCSLERLRGWIRLSSLVTSCCRSFMTTR